MGEKEWGRKGGEVGTSEGSAEGLSVGTTDGPVDGFSAANPLAALYKERVIQIKYPLRG